MSFRSLSTLAVTILVVVFSVLNWQAMTTPNTLSLGVAHVQAPLGLIMLAMVVVLAVGAALVLAVYRTRWLADVRRMEKDLHRQRELADKAELSRFVGLQTHLDARVDQLGRQLEEQTNRLLQSLSKTHESAQQSATDEAQSLAAQLGELEDRLDRVLAVQPGQLPSLPRSS